MNEPKTFLVVSGMHRSNTSLLAQLLASAGVRFGVQLVEPTASNPLGHFEDVPLVEFHEAVLEQNGTSWHPWRHNSYSVPPELDVKAKADVEDCTAKPGIWGFKIPHATLLLDYWKTYNNAKFVFVFRNPREVIYSALRRTGRQIYYKPYFVLNVYLTYCVYNENILEFCREYNRRAFLIDNRELLASPRKVIEDMNQHLELGLPVEGVDPAIIRTSIKGMKHRTIAQAYSRVAGAGARAREIYRSLQSHCRLQSTGGTTQP